MWLHSLEDPALALPLADPRRFFGGFALEPAPADGAAVYVTVRASERIEDFTANLRAARDRRRDRPAGDQAAAAVDPEALPQVPPAAPLE